MQLVLDQLISLRKTVKDWTVEQWCRDTLNFVLTDFGSKTLTNVAAELGVSESYLSDVVSERWKKSVKVPLASILAGNLARQPIAERGIIPAFEVEDIDPGAGVTDQISQLTDGSPQAFENRAQCETMLFNLWERKKLPTYVSAEHRALMKGVLLVEPFVAGEFDFADAIASLPVMDQELDDDELTKEDLE